MVRKLIELRQKISEKDNRFSVRTALFSLLGNHEQNRPNDLIASSEFWFFRGLNFGYCNQPYSLPVSEKSTSQVLDHNSDLTAGQVLSLQHNQLTHALLTHR